MYSPEFPFERIAMDRRGLSIQILVANKWTLLCLFLGAIAAVIMNKVKEAQKLSIGFGWWDKHAHVQVSVESISSSNTRSSFTVTADGVFNSKPQTPSTERILERSSVESSRANREKQLKITCQKSVPILKVTLQSRFQSAETQKTDEFINVCNTKIPVDTTTEEMQSCKSFSKEKHQILHLNLKPGVAFTDWHSGVKDTVHGTIQSLERSANVFSLPDWASYLLEPVELTPISNRKPYVHLPGIKAWDFFLNMRVEMSLVCEGKLTSPVALAPTPQRTSRALLVRGPHHIARAKDKVVKVWDCSRKLFLERLQVAEGIISCLDLDWEGKKAFVGNLKTYLSVWDLHRGRCVQTIHSQDQMQAVKCNTSTCILTGSRASRDPLAYVKVWDARTLKQHAGIVSSTISDISGMESRGLECYTRDSKGIISAYDLRMLGGLSPLQSFCANDRKPLQVTDSESFAITEKLLPGMGSARHVDDEWWDADTELLHSDDYECADDEGSWVKPQGSENTRTCLLSRFITAVCSFGMPLSEPRTQ